jgi:cell division septum initiation protein DivIVA
VKRSGFNLRDRKFRTVFWGADRREVQAAIDAVVTEYERIQAELRQISEEREALAREIERIIELDRSVVRVLVAAEEEAGIRRAAARRHSTALVAQAEEQAASLLRESERERDGLQQELSAYVERRQHAVRTLNALIGQMGARSDEPPESVSPQENEPAASPAASLPPAQQATAAPPGDDWLAEIEENLRAAARETPPPVVDTSDPSEAETQDLEHDTRQLPGDERAIPAPAPSRSLAAAVAAAAVEPPPDQPATGAATAAAAGALPTPESEGAQPPPRAAIAAVGESTPPPAAVGASAVTDRSAPLAPVGIAAVSENTDPSRARRLSRGWVAAAGLAAAAVIAIAVGLPGLGLGRSKPAGEPVKLGPSASQAAAPASGTSTPAAKADALPTTGSGGTQPSAAALNVRLRPLRECWVRVIVDGQSDERTLQPGEDIMLHGQQHVVLRVGDAGALSVELNGRQLPPLGADGQVVNKRIDASTAVN